MSQIRQDRCEFACQETAFGADHPEPGKTLDLLTELGHCSGVVRQQIEGAHEQLRNVKSLCDELRAARSENDRLRAALEDLHSQVTDGFCREDALRAEASAEQHRALAALAARSDLERRLVEAEDQLRTATEKLDQLETEAQRVARAVRRSRARYRPEIKARRSRAGSRSTSRRTAYDRSSLGFQR